MKDLPTQIEFALINKLDLFVSNSLFWRNFRNEHSWPSFGESFVKYKELIVSSGSFPRSSLVNSDNVIYDMASVELRFYNLEIEIFIIVQWWDILFLKRNLIQISSLEFFFFASTTIILLFLLLVFAYSIK